MGNRGKHGAKGCQAGTYAKPLADRKWIALCLRGNYNLTTGFYLPLCSLGYGAVGINDIGVAFLGSVAKASCLLDIVSVVLAFLKCHCIWLVDIARSANRVVETRNDELVSVHQLDVLC